MADKELSIIISAKNMASKAIADAQKQVQDFSQKTRQYLANAAEASTQFATSLAVAGAGVGAMAKIGVDYNAQLELTTKKIYAMTKSQEETAKIMDYVQSQAKKSIFSFQDMGTAASALVPISKQSGIALKDLIKQAEILGASNPLEGLAGASFALKEAMTGDFTSIIERFNLSRSYINKLKDEGVPAMEIISKALGQMGVDYSMVEQMAGSFKFRLDTLKDSMTMFAGEITKPMFDYFSVGLASITEKMPQIQESIRGFIDLLVQNKEVVLGVVLGALVPAFGALAVAIGGMMLTLAPFMVAGVLIVQNWEPLKAFFVELTAGLGGVGGAFSSAKDIIASVVSTSSEILKVFSQIAGEVFLGIKNFLVSEIFPIFQELQKTVEVVFGWISSFWQEWGAEITFTLQSFFEGIKVIFTLFWEVFSEIFKAGLAFLRGDWAMAWEYMKNSFAVVWNAIKTIAVNLWEGLKAIFSVGGDLISGAWNAVLDGMKNKTIAIWDGIKLTIASSINWVIQKINAVIQKVNGVSGKVGVPSIPEIPSVAFANGGTFNGFGTAGIVRSPIMGVAGEAGPEAIVPLPDGRSIPVSLRGGSGGGPNIVVNVSVNGSVMAERDLVDNISQRLAQVLFSQGVRA